MSTRNYAYAYANLGDDRASVNKSHSDKHAGDRLRLVFSCGTLRECRHTPVNNKR
ncbi:hypothetical protein LC605_13975 [Nostoc sp. CHAB 5836]|uniref:hypothetical protein n=1 Tax=Nostoc sp. CHAB 5836 TaxID=2780404 RepID=UPI001E5513AF|nr:hypothetical protein [Nostoc sp. CHAB 5836]MCC5616154.1 hypothetical protein [Nostoc sp. CHAB 5836]